MAQWLKALTAPPGLKLGSQHSCEKAHNQLPVTPALGYVSNTLIWVLRAPIHLAYTQRHKHLKKNKHNNNLNIESTQNKFFLPTWKNYR